MGRARRTRLRKAGVEYEENIDLRRFVLSGTGIKGPVAKIANFPGSGRGFMALKNIPSQSEIIRVPLQKLISYKTLSVSCLKCGKSFASFLQGTYTMQDILSVFLAIEMKKSNSQWRVYIDSLPKADDICLPWFYNDLEDGEVPAELLDAVRKKRESFEESWNRARIFTTESSTCLDCLLPPENPIDEQLYRYAYSLVNTRAVYVNPDIIMPHNKAPISGKVDMALCPLLDMFNHSSEQTTTAEIVASEAGAYYVLKNAKGTKKYEQIFISYGQHDNAKLFVEYGFSLKNNIHERFRLKLDEITSTGSLSCTKSQFRFLSKNTSSSDIYMDLNGLSHGLKMCLYTLKCPGMEQNWGKTVFSQNYSLADLNEMTEMALTLLQGKVNGIQNYLLRLEVRTGLPASLYMHYLQIQVFLTKILAENLRKQNCVHF